LKGAAKISTKDVGAAIICGNRTTKKLRYRDADIVQQETGKGLKYIAEIYTCCPAVGKRQVKDWNTQQKLTQLAFWMIRKPYSSGGETLLTLGALANPVALGGDRALLCYSFKRRK
jgi:hypothetical protein